MSAHSILKRATVFLMLLIVAGLLTAMTPPPDVTHSTETKISFEGLLGRIMKMTGAADPIQQTLYLKGNRERIDSFDKEGRPTNSTIIDLDNKQVINIDHERKRYTVLTFAELKQLLQSQSGDMSEEMEEDRMSEEQPEVEMEFDFSVDELDKNKKIAGYPARQYLMKITGKAKTEADAEDGSEEVSGTLTIETTLWQSDQVDNYDELQRFTRAILDELGELPGNSSFSGFISVLQGNNPSLSEGFKKMQHEVRKLKGLTLESRSRFLMEKTAAKSGEGIEDNSMEIPSSLGGLMKGFGKKFGKKKKQQKGPRLLMETVTVTKKYSTTAIDDAVFDIPAGYQREEMMR